MSLYIYGAQKIRSQGRLVVTEYFAPEKTPRKVLLVIDADKKSIVLFDADSHPEQPGIRFCIDERNRIWLPKWILEELNNNEDVVFIYDDQTGVRYIAPRDKAPLIAETLE